MNTKQLYYLAAALLLAGVHGAIAQSTAFTYQGQLTADGLPADGSYSLRFILYNAEFGGSQVGPTLTNEPVSVANGLFTTTLNFGATVLDGSPRWLEIAVRTNGSAAVHTALSPRQPLGSAPYAFRAARLTGILPDAQLSANVARLNDNGTFVGNVVFDPRSGPPFAVGNNEVVIKLNADQVDGLDASAFALVGHHHDTNYWKLTGNVGVNSTNGAFLGTTDNQPLDIRVNNRRAWRAEPGGFSGTSTPNIIGGASGNIASNAFFQRAAEGVVIGGGGSSTGPNVVLDNFGVIVGGARNTNNGDHSFLGGGLQNYVEDRNNVLGGGLRNSLDGRQCFLGGGESNVIRSISIDSVITGGANNLVRADFAMIGGGANNVVDSSSDFGTVCGGSNNEIDSGVLYGTIPGGFSNFVDGDYAFAAGRRARAVHDGAFVWADSQDTNFTSTAANQFLVRAAGGVGLGTAAPGNPLAVVGNGTTLGGAGGGAEVVARFRDNGASHTAISIDAPAGQDAILYLSENGAAAWDLRHDTDASHQFQLRAQRGSINNVVLAVTTNGNVTIDGALTESSDRNRKTDIEAIDARAVLEKVSVLPLASWRYQTDAPEVKHLGPMAQDFHAAFGLNGSDDKHIATVDANGVALAAIQGLNQKLTEGLKRRDVENAELKEELQGLKELMRQLNQKVNRDRP